MPVGEDSGADALDPLRQQDRAKPGERIGMHRHDKAHPLEPRCDGHVQVASQIQFMARVL